MFSPFGFMGTQAGGDTYLLDSYGSATVAYSLRKLSSSATNAIRVRRSNDNSETDIGFVGEALDTTSLTSFVGANSAYIVKWYDQSGNSNDATQSTTAQQPRIINAGTLETINSLPALFFDSSNDYFDLTSNVATSDTSNWVQVLNRSSSTLNMTLGTTTSSPYGPYWYSDNNLYYAPSNGGGSSGRINGNTGHRLIFTDAVGGQVGFYDNNSLVTGITVGYSYAANNYIYLGRRNAEYYNGKQQEFILWDVDYSADRTDIQDNINTYYSIY